MSSSLKPLKNRPRGRSDQGDKVSPAIQFEFLLISFCPFYEDDKTPFLLKLSRYSVVILFIMIILW
jgi:hypothetical protein